MNNHIKVQISLYRIFSRAYFHLPFMVIYLSKIGFSLITIEIIMAIYGLAVFTYTKLPTGLKPNFHFSCKYVLLISEIFKFIGLILVVLTQNIAGISIAQIFLGFGYGIAAGCDTRIINHHIDDGGKFQSRSNSLMFAALLVAGLLGSVLFNIDIRLPFIASALADVVTGIVCMTLPNEPGKIETLSQKGTDTKLTYQEKSLVCTYCLTRGIILTFFTGFLPYHLFVDLDIPVYGFIAILTSYTFLCNISSNLIAGRLKKEYAVRIMNICLLLSLIMYFSNNLIMIVVATILLGLTSGATRPICLNGLRDNGSNVALVSNKMEGIYSIINIALLILGGILYYFYGFVYMHLLLAFVFIIYILLHFYFMKRSNEYEKQS